MKTLLLVALLSLVPFGPGSTVVFSLPPSNAGGIVASAWVTPDGSDSDTYAYESFILDSTQAITEVRWRGGYLNDATLPDGSQDPVTDFSITFYESIPGGSEPHCGNPDFHETIYLARYVVGNNAGETPAGIFGGKQMYDYHYVLPTTFPATSGTKYWVKIEASQSIFPDWGLTVGIGGNGSHYRFITGEAMFHFVPNDTNFALLASIASTVTITAVAEPANGGSVSGSGSYPGGASVTVSATPNPDFSFVNWTESGSPVSVLTDYQFIATADHTLVAHFAPAYTITTSAAPSDGGTTTGDGSYPEGASASVVASPNPGFAFVNWTQNDAVVSDLASYQFTVAANRHLVANFVAQQGKVFLPIIENVKTR